MVSVQVTPDPGEAERTAILAALAAEEAEQRSVSSEWAAALLPAREGEEAEP